MRLRMATGTISYWQLAVGSWPRTNGNLFLPFQALFSTVSANVVPAARGLSPRCLANWQLLIVPLLVLGLLLAAAPSPALGRITADLSQAQGVSRQEKPNTENGAANLVFSRQGQPPSSPNSSTPVAEAALSALSTAIQQEDPSATLACFDPAMPDFADFAESVRSLFEKYSGFRVRYHILQTGEKNDNPALVEFTLEATPQTGNEPPVRRTQELRFTFGQSNHGWRISDLQPRGFFSAF